MSLPQKKDMCEIIGRKEEFLSQSPNLHDALPDSSKLHDHWRDTILHELFQPGFDSGTEYRQIKKALGIAGVSTTETANLSLKVPSPKRPCIWHLSPHMDLCKTHTPVKYRLNWPWTTFMRNKKKAFNRTPSSYHAINYCFTTFRTAMVWSSAINFTK